MKKKLILCLSLVALVSNFSICATEYTMRLNPFSIGWPDAYCYVWESDSYSYNGTTYREYRITDTLLVVKAELDETTGWLTATFDTDKDNLAIGWYNSRESYLYWYSDSNSSTYVNFGISESTCFSFDNNDRLNQTTYVALLPNESNSYSIHVEVAGSFGNLFLSQVSQWTDVVALTITGTLNSDDLAYLSRMSNLQVLDLSGTNITSVSGCSGLTHLTKVILPNSVTTIAANAFEGCQMLRNINLENILSIGNSSFYYCYGLCELSLPNVESIGNSAFYECRNLSKVEMPKVQSIGQSAFLNCSLVSVNLSSVTSLGSYAFRSNDSLQKVVLSDYLYKIPDYCFEYCQNLSDINIPLYVSSIGRYAFHNVPIKNVVLSEGVTAVGSNNFNVSDTIVLPSTLTEFSSYSSNWKEVYCYLISPNSFSMVTDCNDCYSNTRLHVPAFSVAAYKLDDNWYKFKEILPIDGDVSNISINSPFSLYSVSGISNEANLSLQSGGSLTTMANDTLKLSNYVQKIDTRWTYNGSSSYDENDNYYEYYSKSSSYMSSLVANSPIRANKVRYDVMIYFDRWNFISFPFDVNISDIEAPYNTKWVIREYNGTNRALGTGVTWENVAEDAVLKAHKGYILYASNSSYSYNWFSSPASNQTRQNVFATTDQAVPLSHYEAEYAQNKSWNLVGNPYPCAIDISSTDFTAPITVWYGGGYTAYSPLDDNYVLRPCEAFFVQAPDGSDAITFSKDGRSADMSFQVLYDEYNTNGYYAPAKVRNSDNRKVYNFVVTDNENFDRARVVFNENASAEYELERDAAKMFASNSDMPQLFVNDNNIQYSICERPEQNSSFVLGLVAGKEGEYSLSLNTSTDDEVTLYDTENEVSLNLTNDKYTFTSKAGTYPNRFIVNVVNRTPTSLATQNADSEINVVENKLSVVADQNVEIRVYSIDGRMITNRNTTNMELQLCAGVYIVNVSGVNHKVVIK